MRPQEIEKIARVVVGSFPQQPYQKTGCAGFSDPQAFSCVDDFNCAAGDYDCGGAAQFGCSSSFSCEQGFFCSCDFSQT